MLMGDVKVIDEYCDRFYETAISLMKRYKKNNCPSSLMDLSPSDAFMIGDPKLVEDWYRNKDEVCHHCESKDNLSVKFINKTDTILVCSKCKNIRL